MLGICLGFGFFFFLMKLVDWRNWREVEGERTASYFIFRLPSSHDKNCQLSGQR